MRSAVVKTHGSQLQQAGVGPCGDTAFGAEFANQCKVNAVCHVVVVPHSLAWRDEALNEEMVGPLEAIEVRALVCQAAWTSQIVVQSSLQQR